MKIDYLLNVLREKERGGAGGWEKNNSRTMLYTK